MVESRNNSEKLSPDNDASKEGSEKRDSREIKKFIGVLERTAAPLTNNKDVWLYTLNSLGEITEEQIGKVADVYYKLRKEDKNVGLSTIFKEAKIQLPEDSFFDSVCFDYYLPLTNEEMEKANAELKKTLSKKFKERYGSEVFEITSGFEPREDLKRLFINDLNLLTDSSFGSTPMVEEKETSKDGKQNRKFTITDYGQANSKRIKDRFNRLKPFLRKNNLIITTWKSDTKVVTKNY